MNCKISLSFSRVYRAASFHLIIASDYIVFFKLIYQPFLYFGLFKLFAILNHPTANTCVHTSLESVQVLFSGRVLEVEELDHEECAFKIMIEMIKFTTRKGITHLEYMNVYENAHFPKSS